MRLSTVFRVSITFVLAVVLLSAAVMLFPAAAAPEGARWTVRDLFNVSPQTMTLSGTQTITPTFSNYHLAPPNVLTITLTVGDSRPGDRLRLGSTVITDTAILATNTALTATLVLTQNDVAEFEVLNGQWVEVFRRDNDQD